MAKRKGRPKRATTPKSWSFRAGKLRTRKFGNRIYRPSDMFKKKVNAIKWAHLIRSRGYLARITKSKKGYIVWGAYK